MKKIYIINFLLLLIFVYQLIGIFGQWSAIFTVKNDIKKEEGTVGLWGFCQNSRCHSFKGFEGKELPENIKTIQAFTILAVILTVLVSVCMFYKVNNILTKIMIFLSFVFSLSSVLLWNKSIKNGTEGIDPRIQYKHLYPYYFVLTSSILCFVNLILMSTM